MNTINTMFAPPMGSKGRDENARLRCPPAGTSP